MGFSARRASAVAALLVVAALDLHSSGVGLRAHARLRERTLGAVRQATERVRARLAAVLAPGGQDAWHRAAMAALETGGVATAEVFLVDGGRAASYPHESGSHHWPTAREQQRLREGEVTTAMQLAGPSPRVMSYFLAPSGSTSVLVRLSADAGLLVADLRDRQEALVAQGLALLVVLAMVALVAPSPREAAAPAGLVAYEEAMGRLRAHDEQMARQHQDERLRMEGELKEKAPFVRAGELTVGIVHEIRNGLGTIVGHARLVQSRGGEAAEDARAIVQECETLETVVRRFMEFVKDEALRPETFDLGRMLVRVAARESRAGPGTLIVPPRGEAGTIEADEDLIERVFENLVRNARDAAGPTGHVWIDVERRDGGVTVVIADDGPGMPADVRARLRPFFTTKAGGLGLGLPLALKIVRQHGGEMTLEERSPRGLAVRVTLPARRSDPVAPVTEGNRGGGTGGVRDVTTRGGFP